MPEREIRLPDGTPLYAVLPEGARRGMIVIHQIFGRPARRWLCEAAGLEAGRVGLIGFCFGGGFALAAGPGFAAATNYGEVPPTAVMRGIGPVIGCYAGRDRLFDNGAKLTARLAPLGVAPEVHRFETVGHSFLTDGHHPIGFALSRFFFHAEARDPAVREAAWTRILEFFERKIP